MAMEKIKKNIIISGIENTIERCSNSNQVIKSNKHQYRKNIHQTCLEETNC